MFEFAMSNKQFSFHVLHQGKNFVNFIKQSSSSNELFENILEANSAARSIQSGWRSHSTRTRDPEVKLNLFQSKRGHFLVMKHTSVC